METFVDALPIVKGASLSIPSIDSIKILSIQIW